MNTDKSAQSEVLDRFLAGIERRALIMTELATHDREEALDLVQDAMLAFVNRYAGKSEQEWPPLFYRVLQNKIRDWHRRAARPASAVGSGCAAILTRRTPATRSRSWPIPPIFGRRMPLATRTA